MSKNSKRKEAKTNSSPVAVTSPSDLAPASSKEFLDIHATIECGFTLKCVRDMTRTYSKIYNNMSLHYVNINRLSKKRHSLNIIISECNLHIVCLVETKLSHNVKVNIPGY